MRQTKQLAHLVLLLLILIVTVPTFAQSNFPTQPLTMLIGFNQGGSTDIQGQVLAKVLSEKLGQPVNILYHPGAGGASAAAMLANSRDQGYTFQFGLSLPYTFAPLATPASYQLTSFRYVAGITLDQIALVTGPNTPFATWSEFITYAKANPGLVYASQNIQDRFVINRIMRREGITLRIMPTTGGAGMAPLILSGDADLAFSGGTHSAYTDSGLMRVLASLADERLAHYPQVPNLRELGYDVSMHAIRVITVPANTPDYQVDILAKALQSVTQDARFKKVTEETIKMPVIFMNESELIELFNAQVKEYKQLIAESQ